MQSQSPSGITPQAPDPGDPRNALFWQVVDRLAPLFGSNHTDPRQAACAALAACYPETPLDALDGGRILAFSLSALATLGQAAQPEAAPETVVRLFGIATRLNQAATQADRSLRQRRRQPRPAPPATPRSAEPRATEPRQTATHAAAPLASAPVSAAPNPAAPNPAAPNPAAPRPAATRPSATANGAPRPTAQPPHLQSDAEMDALVEAALDQILHQAARAQPNTPLSPIYAACRADQTGSAVPKMPAGLKAALKLGAAMPPIQGGPFSARTG